MSKLDYYIYDGSDAFRLKITGDLCGPGVASLDQAWRTASSILRGRLLGIDLVSLGAADEYGCGLLVSWHRIGAKIIARSQESRTIAETIIGVPIPLLEPKPRWRQQLSEFLLRRSTAAAGKPAESAITNATASALEHIGR